jgi:hypothetical protein
LYPVFFSSQITRDDITIHKGSHQEQPSYNERFRDIMVSRDSSLKPESGDAINEESTRIAEPDDKDENTVPTSYLSYGTRTDTLYTSSIIPMVVDLIPTDERTMDEGNSLVLQYTDGNVMGLGVTEGEADDILVLDKEVAGRNHYSELIGNNAAQAFLQDSEFSEHINKKTDISMGYFDNKEISKYNSSDSGTEIAGVVISETDEENRVHGPQVHIMDNRILDNAVQGRDRALRQVILSSEHKDPGNLFMESEKDNKATSAEQIGHPEKGERTYDSSLTLEKGFFDNDAESDYDNGNNSDGLGNLILDGGLDLSKALENSDSVGKIEVVEQLARRMVVTLNKRSSELAIEVKPNHLGKLLLKVAIEDGNLTGKIYTNNQQVRDFLQRNLNDLWATLKDQGFVFTSLDVNVGSQPDFEQFHQTRTIRQSTRKAITSSDISRIMANGLSELNQIDCLA